MKRSKYFVNINKIAAKRPKLTNEYLLSVMPTYVIVKLNPKNIRLKTTKIKNNIYSSVILAVKNKNQDNNTRYKSTKDSINKSLGENSKLLK